MLYDFLFAGIQSLKNVQRSRLSSIFLVLGRELKLLWNSIFYVTEYLRIFQAYLIKHSKTAVDAIIERLSISLKWENKFNKTFIN